jgi:hypothetical protein
MEKLRLLKDLTQRTGIIHELQMIQLKHWPYVVFDITDNLILPDDHKRVLSFDVTFAKKKKSKKAEKDLPLKDRAKILEGWVWEILGKEWKVKVRNRVTKDWVYQGERGVNWQPPVIKDVEDRDLSFDDMEEDDAT